ncbi:type II secretion system protein GspM [Pelomonas sp. SE-A7]|uniref:type II secretion system protein GspM n=1 Tax=Pelomonas sp. SE-A7 TaxID=3054953 RepID=UPI00259CCB5F|nr:type II secretion system protein GspM [Pelomonas sp. SE-A7]MDM4766428.1 type II secretion system protein GspM [Pelomonas sp. SE-A7]
MNSSASSSMGKATLSQRLQTQLAPLRGQWQQAAPRERLLVQVGLSALALLLVWLVLLMPALRTLKQAPAKRADLETQLQQMQALALEARELRSQPPVPAAVAQAALQAASERLGSNARLVVSGERATLNLNGISPEALQAWLAEVRSAARARPVEAQLQRGPQGFNGSIVLSIANGVGS